MARIVVQFRDGTDREIVGDGINLDVSRTMQGALVEYLISGKGFLMRVPVGSVNSVEEQAEWAEAT